MPAQASNTCAGGYAHRTRMARTRDEERGARIKALRASIGGPTQKGLGEMIGVAERTVQEWEAGYNIEFDNAVVLARVTNSTVEHILGPQPVADRKRSLETQMAQIESALVALDPDGKRDAREDVRGGFAQVASLVSTLREDVLGEFSELRGDVAALTAQLEKLVQEMGALRRAQAAPGLSSTSGTRKRSPRAKRRPQGQ